MTTTKTTKTTTKTTKKVTTTPTTITTTKAFYCIVVIIAICIGCISQYEPELFLRIPKIGFIFWKVLGGKSVPPYFDSTIWSNSTNFHLMVHDNDTIVSSMPKSGTMWVHQIIHLLKHNGNDDYTIIRDDGGNSNNNNSSSKNNCTDGLMSHVGKAEMLLFPYHTIETRLHEVVQLRQYEMNTNPHRAIKTMTHFSHSSPQGDDAEKGTFLYGLNVRKHPNIKYIYIMRNPLEIIRSLYYFVNNHVPEFRTMWGGFPPIFNKHEDCLNLFFTIPTFLSGPISWWKLRNESNVLLVNYIDLKRNLRGQIQRIASFLEMNITNDLLSLVVEKSTFQYMKTRETNDPCSYRELHGNPNSTTTTTTEGGGRFYPVKHHLGEHGGSSINSSNDDATQEFFTKEMMIKYKTTMEQRIGIKYPDLYKWMVEGGEY